MPDHVHLFVCGGRDFDLGLWVRGVKRAIGVAASVPDADVATSVSDVIPKKPAGTAGATRAGTAGATRAGTARATSLWQPGFFDHLLRNAESYEQKWHYVRENPVRAGLVSRAEDWSYQGEIVALDRM
jgi:REP element-mobilizing transposase RayT